MDESHDGPGNRSEFDAELSHQQTEMIGDIQPITEAAVEVEAEVVEEDAGESVNVFDEVKRTAREVEARKLRGTAKVVKKDELNAVIADMLAKLMRAAENEKAMAFSTRDAAEDAASKATAQSAELEETLARIQTALEQRIESLKEQISKLEAIIRQDDYKSKIMDLEYNLHTVREMLAALRLGVEFFGLIEEIDFGAELQKLESLTNKVADREGSSANPENFAKVRDRLQFIVASLKEDQKLFTALKDAVESGKGSVSVVFDLSQIAWRCRGMLNEAAIMKNLI
ncbi:MAG: hypothetical protein ACYS8W_21035 [Planctomycetota bacterium]|jgi:rubrerythrin